MLLELEALAVLAAAPEVLAVVLSAPAALTAQTVVTAVALDRERLQESLVKHLANSTPVAVEQFAATTTLHLLAVLAVVVMVADPAVLEQLTRVAAVVVLLIQHPALVVLVS